MFRNNRVISQTDQSASQTFVDWGWAFLLTNPFLGSSRVYSPYPMQSFFPGYPPFLMVVILVPTEHVLTSPYIILAFTGLAPCRESSPLLFYSFPFIVQASELVVPWGYWKASSSSLPGEGGEVLIPLVGQC